MSKVIIIGDTHFGELSNSKKYNQQLTEFFTWCTEFAEERGIKQAIHLGDYYHNRNSINVETIQYGIVGAKILSDFFGKKNVYVLLGNHDIYYKDTLEVNSLSIIEPYVTVVDRLLVPKNISEQILLTPWICTPKQWNELVESYDGDFKWLFGHFEFNGFTVSKGHVMEHGHSAKELNQYEKVFSGHYHSKQENGNVLYTGTPIATTFAEANEQHGIHILDTTTGEIEFVEYTTVKVVSIPYTELDTISNYDPTNTRIRVEFPDDLEDETVIDEVQELLHELNFDEIKIKYQGSKVKQLLESVQDAEVQDAEDIDSVVLKFLEQSSSVEGVDSSVMKRYYLKAKEMGEQV